MRPVASSLTNNNYQILNIAPEKSEISTSNERKEGSSLLAWAISSDTFFIYLGLILGTLVSLKLSFFYVVFFPTVILLLLRYFRHSTPIKTHYPSTYYYLLLFVLFAMGSSLMGFDSLPSLKGMLSFLFHSQILCIFFYGAQLGGTRLLARGLIFGATIPCLYSCIGYLFEPPPLQRVFIGTVSQSGQLSMLVILALGFCMQRDFKTVQKMDYCIAGIFCFSILCAGTYLHPLHSPLLSTLIGLILVTSLFCLFLWRTNRLGHFNFILLYLSLPLLFATLLLNLKRGPWIGVFVSVILLLLIHRKTMFVLGFSSVVIILVSTIEPLTSRLLSSSNHFFIHGGRSDLWKIALDLMASYPIGVGYDNSHILLEFSNKIPAELTHFHNNFLNLLVEVGPFATLAFLIWLFSSVKPLFNSSRDRLLAATCGCAILSWQIAGLSEYNIGDSEVLLVAFAIIGMGLGEVTRPKHFARKSTL